MLRNQRSNYDADALLNGIQPIYSAKFLNRAWLMRYAGQGHATPGGFKLDLILLVTGHQSSNRNRLSFSYRNSRFNSIAFLI